MEIVLGRIRCISIKRMFDWNSFWINIYAGSIYFVLSILVSIWLIPKFTLRLIQDRNKKYLRKKISFAIAEVCDFFNHMPSEFKVNESLLVIHSANLKFKKYNDFVSILRPNLLEIGAIERTYVAILNSSLDNSIDRYELMRDKIKRLQKLRMSLENISGLHSIGIGDTVMNEISQLCLEIRIVEKMSEFDKLTEDFTGEKEGIHGLRNLKNVYESAFDLLSMLLKQDGFSCELKTG